MLHFDACDGAEIDEIMPDVGEDRIFCGEGAGEEGGEERLAVAEKCDGRTRSSEYVGDVSVTKFRAARDRQGEALYGAFIAGFREETVVGASEAADLAVSAEGETRCGRFRSVLAPKALSK